MRAITEGEHALSSHGTHDSNKELIFVKLTDSAYRAIENYLQNQQSLSEKPTIQFNGSNGELFFPSDSSNYNKFTFTLSNCLQNEGSNFESIQQTGPNKLDSIGMLPYKMQIHANDEVYETTKHRLHAVDEKNKNKCAQVLKDNEILTKKRKPLKKSVPIASLNPFNKLKRSAVNQTVNRQSLKNLSFRKPSLQSNQIKSINEISKIPKEKISPSKLKSKPILFKEFGDNECNDRTKKSDDKKTQFETLPTNTAVSKNSNNFICNKKIQLLNEEKNFNKHKRKSDYIKPLDPVLPDVEITHTENINELTPKDEIKNISASFHNNLKSDIDHFSKIYYGLELSNYSQDFTRIRNDEQRQYYDDVYSSELPEYNRLNPLVYKIGEHFSNLRQELATKENFNDKEGFKLIEKQIMVDYYYSKNIVARFDNIFKKLQHINQLIGEYDERRVNN